MRDETHAAVVAEMRNRTDLDGGDMVDNFSLDASFGEYGGYDPIPLIKAYADRAEAAHKREVDNLNSVIQTQRSHFDAEIDRLRREEISRRGAEAQSGNAARLREALEKCANMGEQIDCQLGSSDETVYAFRDERCLAHNISECARSALAAPPRACDIMPEENLVKVVSNGIMQSITSRPEFNFDGLKALVEVVAASAIKCAYDMQLISKGATDGSK